ncbi:MAG: CHAT domain-containing protein [Acidobacteriota bacterium]|nr:CHAT domain-containing protein [Acidobacteriota bacterium]
MEELPTPPGLQAVEKAFAEGRLGDARQQLLRLSEEERQILAAEMGEEAVASLTRSAARGVHRQKQGRVVVINGIMGALLDRRLQKGDQRIWVSLWKLFNGHLKHLRMGLNGGPADPDTRIVIGGLHKSYWRLQLELDSFWHVLPCPFDWRLDIDRSAEALAKRIRGWAKGEPVHIVAHSMGGLVARRMIHRFPDLWESMDDADGHHRGGRLIMLGTPNKGSFAITLTLTGEEKAVRRLALVDRKHGMRATLSTISTFHGPYQMLPSPEVEVGDDRQQLFGSTAWGTTPHHQELLDLGARFQREMATVETPDRLIYVAGYDYDTPHRIRVDGPGEFSYQQTREGDGRVPHELGLLPEVTTYWVREIHGKLPESEHVLEDVHELLANGSAQLLLASKPTQRRAVEEPRWQSPEEIQDEAAELEATRWESLLEAATVLEQKPSRRGEAAGKGDEEGEPREPELAAAEARATLETSLTDGWLGGGSPLLVRNLGARPTPPQAEERRTPPLKLQVDVVWGDIRRIPGDVYCVGHYHGVPPQRAEEALDQVVSGTWDPDPQADEPKNETAAQRPVHVLDDLTARGILSGELGQITFYPWAWSAIEKQRSLGETSGGESEAMPTVAIAGMGYPGTFDEARLRRLARNLSWTIGLLPHVRTACTVLIGSGDGGLTVGESLRGMLAGMRDTLSGGILTTGLEVTRLRIVEIQLDRAHQIHEELLMLQAKYPQEFQLEIRADFSPQRGGWLSDEYCLSLVLGAIHHAVQEGASHAKIRTAAEDLLKQSLTQSDQRLPQVLKALREITLERRDGEQEKDYRDRLATSLRVQRRSGQNEKTMAARISFIKDGKALRVAAIQSSAVIPERVAKIDFRLIEELVERLKDPTVEDLEEYSPSLDQLLVPRDFRSKIRFGQKMIFEVNRDTARIPFEMLPSDAAKAGGEAPFLALSTTVSRQLRTTYSPPPVVKLPTVQRALVIGDPGDPKRGHDLPGAREEARRAVRILRSKGWHVDALIGVSVGRDRQGDEPGFPPATRLDVLHLLNKNQYDLLHYCGHGDFDAKDPERAGWRFKDGLLTAAELEKMDRVPQLVVANACLTSRISQLLHGGTSAERSEIGLLPTLADEFFRRGVRNYIGTAWAINDAGAVLFMEELYGALLPNDRPQGEPLGEALRIARKALWDRRKIHGSLWAAYHHYGDPDLVFERGEERE